MKLTKKIILPMAALCCISVFNSNHVFATDSTSLKTCINEVFIGEGDYSDTVYTVFKGDSSDYTNYANCADGTFIGKGDYSDTIYKVFETDIPETRSGTVKYYYKSYSVDDENSPRFGDDITLTSTYKYGKVFYSNNSNKKVTITVSGCNPVIIDPYKTGGITWEYTGTSSKNYSAYVESEKASVNLVGYYSLARSDEKFK